MIVLFIIIIIMNKQMWVISKVISNLFKCQIEVDLFTTFSQLAFLRLLGRLVLLQIVALVVTHEHS